MTQTPQPAELPQGEEALDNQILDAIDGSPATFTATSLATHLAETTGGKFGDPDTVEIGVKRALGGRLLGVDVELNPDRTLRRKR